MWKITNKRNENILKRFHTMVIEPLFKEMISYKHCENKYNTFLAYLSEECTEKIYYNVLKYICNTKHKKILFADCVQQLLEKPILELKSCFALYNEQNIRLNNKDYNIECQKLDPIYKVIFADFFYDRFFSDDTIWLDIHPEGKKYSRKIFHDNFCDENKLYVCPYCDTDTIISNGNSVIEHFIPKSIYPYLSMNANNLISSCYSCNGSYGKLSQYIMPIASPFIQQIGNDIDFNLDLLNQQIIIKAMKTEVLNYINMMKLNNKYQTKKAFDYVVDKAEWVYDIKEQDVNNEITPELLSKYIRCKKEPFSIAILSTFSDSMLYKKNSDFKKNINV